MTRRIFWWGIVALSALLALTAAAATWLFATEAGLRWAYGQLRAGLAGTLAVERLEGTLAGPLTVQGLRYRSDAFGAQIEILSIDWSPAALLLGRVQIDALALEGARVMLKETDEPARRAATRFTLPFNVGVADLRVQDVHIERPGRERYTVYSVELAGFLGQQVARVDRLHIDAQYVTATAEGALGLDDGTDQQLRVAWRVALPGRPAVQGAGTLTGNLAALRLRQDVTAPIIATVRADIRAPLHEYFEASGTFDAHVKPWPAVAGRFRVGGTAAGNVGVQELQLRVPNTDMQLALQGQWQSQPRTWQAQARWQNLRWPLAGDAAVISPHGTLRAQGTRERYELQLEATTLGARLPQVHWRAKGNGDRAHIALEDIGAETLGTVFRGQVNAAWSPRLRWQAQVRADGINPAVQWPQWPGSLALAAGASGERGTMRIGIEKLAGSLRGYKFTAGATAVRRDASFPTLALHLRAGAASAKLEGSLSDQWNLAWQLDAEELRSLLPETAGGIRGSGRVTGPRDAPRVEAELAAATVSHRTTRLDKAALHVALDLSDRTPSEVSLRAAGGALYGRAFEGVGLHAHGRLSNHAVTVDLQWPGQRLQAELSGAYADRTWKGALEQSTLQFANATWELAGKPGLFIAPNRAALDEACWLAGAARLCLDLRHARTEGTRVGARAQEVPLGLFRPALPEVLGLSGTLNGHARAHLEAGRWISADARLHATSGSINLAEPAKTSIAYDNASVRLVIDDSGLHADAKIAFPNGDDAMLTMALPQFHSGTELKRQPIKGRVTLQLRDLTPLDALLLQIDELRGSLRADLSLSGMLAAPRLRGQMTLADAVATVPAIGIRVQDMRLTATATGGEEIRLNGEARSGGGTLGLSGRLSFPDDQPWRAELRVAGAQFLAVDLRDTRAYVSPDLHALITPGAIRVTGEVRLPQATFALRPPQGVVTASPDVVIVNAPEPVAAETPWKIAAEVRVILGDAVTFRGFGLSAKISGDVLLIDAPGQATTARGELRVAAGEYEAYGQKLQVERGRLLFVGGPVNNPGMDARAVRRVDNVTVGVEVKGTLQSPQLTLFSDPPMAQADALSYLLFGRPLERTTTSEGRALAAAARALKLAGGERLAQRIGAQFGIEEIDIETGSTSESAALVLGKQLSPRLYINYSIGLFEPQNVLRLRYRLSPNWSLEAQSGKSAGGDLLYTIER